MRPYFTEREIRAVTVFLPLILLLSLGVIFYEREQAKVFTQRLNEEYEQKADTLRLQDFDPNEVEYEQLREMGLSKYVSVNLLKYRQTGKIFRIKEDVALCYGISDSLYQRLKPYIKIGKKYQIKKTYTATYPTRSAKKRAFNPQQFRIDTVSVDFLYKIGVMTRRQAKAFIRWRDMSGMRDMEEVRACYVVSDSLANVLEQYILFPEEKNLSKNKLDINLASEEELLSVVGIGKKTARRIVDYRKKLGGFVSTEQISEIKGMTESNYEKILKQISCKNYVIRKIDINFASPKEMLRHPYIRNRTLRKLLKYRELKGGWRNLEEMKKDDILSEEEARKLAPYVQFGNFDSSNNPQKD